MNKKDTSGLEFFELAADFSTTRCVTRTQPVIVNTPDEKIHTSLFLPDYYRGKVEGGLRTQGYFKLSLADKPLISIVTVVFNGEKHLQQTIQSVINQDYDNVEYIIIDGASTDGTLDILEQYDKYLDYWGSEPDKGISDAFNKGISLCNGDIIGILNADDWYSKDAFKHCIATFTADNSIDVYLGAGSVYSSAGFYKKVFPKHSEIPRKAGLFHAGIFVKRRCYSRYGGFNVKYKLAMDYECLLNFYVNGCKFISDNKEIANMRLDGASDSRWLKAYYEVYIIQGKFFNNKFILLLRFVFSVVKTATRRLLDKLNLNFIVEGYRKKYG